MLWDCKGRALGRALFLETGSRDAPGGSQPVNRPIGRPV